MEGFRIKVNGLGQYRIERRYTERMRGLFSSYEQTHWTIIRKGYGPLLFDSLEEAKAHVALLIQRDLDDAKAGIWRQVYP